MPTDKILPFDMIADDFLDLENAERQYRELALINKILPSTRIRLNAILSLCARKTKRTISELLDSLVNAEFVVENSEGKLESTNDLQEFVEQLKKKIDNAKAEKNKSGDAQDVK